MYRRLLLIAVAGALIGAANARTLEILEGAYEAVLSEVTLPGSAAGTLIFRPCPSCDPRVHTVTGSTTYHIGPSGRPLPLAEFLAQVEELRQGPGGAQSIGIGIFYSLETDRITRIGVYPPVSR